MKIRVDAESHWHITFACIGDRNIHFQTQCWYLSALVGRITCRTDRS